jgi:hypothetical protein
MVHKVKKGQRGRKILCPFICFFKINLLKCFWLTGESLDKLETENLAESGGPK